jgi:anti-anti-sigma factor
LLRISGDVDLSTTEALRNALLSHLRQISRPAVVDLTEVTHLASAGVRLLAETLQSSAFPIRVQCPPGSPAHRVLTLTGLDRVPGFPTSR